MRKAMRGLWLAVAGVAAVLAGSSMMAHPEVRPPGPADRAPAVSIMEYPLPTAAAGPNDIAAGPDGDLWFVEQTANKIGRITVTGVISEVALPSGSGAPAAITGGPDGNLWFTESTGNAISRITPAGSITEFPLPNTNSGPAGICAGPDGNVWFTELTGNRIGRITPAGQIADYPIPRAAVGPAGITAGPDGNLWFTESTGNGYGRATPDGASIVDYLLPNAGSGPGDITAGPDGNLWFIETAGDRIARITTGAVLTEFPVPSAGAMPAGIAAGRDGNLWFTEQATGVVASITVAGVVAEYPVPAANSGPTGITSGPDGNIWFTEYSANNIAVLSGLVATPSATATATLTLTATTTPSPAGTATPTATVPTSTPTSTATPTNTSTPTPTPTSPPLSIVAVPVNDFTGRPVPGWLMYLFVGPNCAGNPIRQAVTDSSGLVNFGALAPGPYSVQEAPQPNWTPAGATCQNVTARPPANLGLTVDAPAPLYPPAGTEVFTSALHLTLAVAGVATASLTLQGSTTLNLSNPYPGPGGRTAIDTQVAALHLAGASAALGAVTVAADPGRPSAGQIVQQAAGADFPAFSTLDLYVVVSTAAGPLHNAQPIPLQATIGAIPPLNTLYRPLIAAAIPLYNAQDQAAGSLQVALYVPLAPGGILVVFRNRLPCPVPLRDVPPSNPFAGYIGCLACGGIVSGYADGTFRPFTSVTRGQLAKFIANAAGYTDAIPPGQQSFADVLPGDTFWPYIELVYAHGIVSGYACGTAPAGPCDGSHRPYFLPAANVTRGQTAKFVANAAAFPDVIPAGQQTFADVPPANPFWLYVERASLHDVISGYRCGVAPAGGCLPGDAPYFLPANSVTRGQTAKFIASTFFPDCPAP